SWRTIPPSQPLVEEKGIGNFSSRQRHESILYSICWLLIELTQAMEFEWDEDKEAANLKKHKVSITEAETIFGDPLSRTFPDPDHSIDKDRYITIGTSDRDRDRVLVVAHTDRDDRLRIISARKATRGERKAALIIVSATLHGRPLTGVDVTPCGGA